MKQPLTAASMKRALLIYLVIGVLLDGMMRAWSSVHCADGFVPDSQVERAATILGWGLLVPSAAVSWTLGERPRRCMMQEPMR